jgi:serine/threonine protein kinase
VSLPAHLGRLERVERIGAGGFATVWRYHDPDLHSDVAVKALADNWAQRLDVRERFVEEARILRRADSDHIVRVYDIGEVDQTPYFVMTYADLGSLARLLDSGAPLPPGRVADLIAQAGAGLRVLHEQGVVHRDIKPQNLLRRSQPSGGERLLVADLGVAKAMLHASGLTQVVGTPAYMAPEQALGGAVDARADVHALAAVAYQMLTGHLAREGTVTDLRTAELPAKPSTLVDLPSAVDDVLLRALDPRPERRHPDIESFVADVRDVLATTESVRPSPTPSTSREVVTLQEPARPTPGEAGRRTSFRLALICLLVFAAAFAVAYFAVSVLR